MSAWDCYIKDFVSFLKIEKGLSENSILAYQNDVVKLKEFSEMTSTDPTSLSYDQLKVFVASLFDLGLSARTQARIISGIKQFFHYLLIEDLVKDDPS